MILDLTNGCNVPQYEAHRTKLSVSFGESGSVNGDSFTLLGYHLIAFIIKNNYHLISRK
jgi:hypothetical protein